MAKKEEIQKRIEKLKKEINYHRNLYHEKDILEISEEALDSLKDELKKLEKKFPEFLKNDSPSLRVAGKPLEGFSKITHKIPQWSFDDAFSFEDLKDFEKKLENLKKKNSFFEKKDLQYFCELKIDGLKVVLEYENGILKTAATRGDGKVGEDVTQNIKTIKTIPLKLNKKISGIFEGEIYLSKKNFENLNKKRKKEGLETYANPRNVASGSVRQLDPKIVEQRKLDAFIYDVAQISNKAPLKNQKEEIDFLKSLGFQTNKNNFLAKSLEEVWNFYKNQTKIKDDYGYLIDGIVLKVNQRELQEFFGYTGKAPRFAIALKFPAEQKTTIIKEISLQLGRTGVLTPVAELEKVSLAGTSVSRASLHNADEIERLDVRVGDTVIVEKAGDIIPKVVEVLKNLRPKKSKKYVFPKTFAGCGADGKIFKPAGDVYYRCVDFSGKEVVKKKLEYFVSKKAFDIEGLGGANVKSFVEKDFLKEPADIFKLPYEKIEKMEGFGEKSVENLKKSIEEKREISLSRFLIALSIFEVGEETSILLSENFEKLEKIQKAKKEEFEKIDGIGIVVAEKIFSFFKDKKNIKEIKNLLKEIKIRKNIKNKKVNKNFDGKTFAVTGSFENFSREQIFKIVRDFGGKPAGAISKKTDFLIVGENSGSKKEKAQKLKIKILTEKDFAKMF